MILRISGISAPSSSPTLSGAAWNSKGYAVRHVMNITDVEDKIIQRVTETNASLRDYTAKYEAAFFEDFQALGCLRPHETPRATDCIADIISLIGKLMARGMAYRAADGSVYFSIEKYQAAGCRYGQLLKLNFEEMRPGQRVSSDEYAKEAVADFALWKARVPADGARFLAQPLGRRAPRLAYRVQRDEHETARTKLRSAHGGRRLDFPAP